MNRREFFRGLAAVAAAAMMPTAVMAAVGENKYEKAVRLYDAVIAAGNDQDLVADAFDVLVEHFRDEFPNPVFDTATISELDQLLFTPPEDVDPNDLRKVPPKYCDAILPVAMLQTLLRNHNTPISTNKTKMFKYFKDTYGLVVISAMNRRFEKNG